MIKSDASRERRAPGIHTEALRGWVRRAEADRGERDDRLTTAEQDELKRAKR
ncbi:transposase [Streptomyces sp. Tue6028]|uniref:transposase n=1 Tax=Streptomyces sp. Tue6028 TaxID=2036037 RepID=UPI003D7298F3